MPTSSVLQNLRDIHLPSPISIWPLAPGWYLVLLSILICLALLVYRHCKRHKEHLLLRAAITELEQLQQQYNIQGATLDIVTRLSSLLRRAALARYPRRDVAGLHGQNWLQFLDQTGQTVFFTTELGQILITAPYKTQTNTLDLAPLIMHIKLWLEHNLINHN